MPDKAFFLDRDGTINKDTGYVMSPEKVELLEGAGEAIHKMNMAGYLVIVISNQSGVARGMGTEEDVKRVNKQIQKLLESYDAKIDAFYFCPHHKKGIIKKYAIDCGCRKPKLGMFEQAIADYQLKPQKCIAAGDKKRDIENLHQLGVTECGIVESKNSGEYRSLLEYTNKVLEKN